MTAVPVPGSLTSELIAHVLQWPGETVLAGKDGNQVAVDAVITSPQALRDVSAALAADPRALARGAPPVVGRLVTELIARGSATLAEPACVRCGRAGRPLTATGSGGMCARCRPRAG